MIGRLPPAGAGCLLWGGLRKASWLEEFDNLVEGTVDGAFRIFGAVAEGDDGGDGFFARDLEEGAEAVGITLANMSILKTGKAKAVKVSTLAKICEALECQPGDILEYRKKGGDARYMQNRTNATLYDTLIPRNSGITQK